MIQSGAGIDDRFLQYNLMSTVKQICTTSNHQKCHTRLLQPVLIYYGRFYECEIWFVMLKESPNGILVDKDSLVEKQEVTLVNLKEE